MTTTDPEKEQHRPAFKPVEVIGGALAAVTSAVIASYAGVGGTLVGVAVGSVASSVGATVYNSWLHRASGRIAVTRTLVTSAVAGRPTSVDDPAALPPGLADDLVTGPPVEVTAPAPAARARWKPVAALAAVTFVLGLATLTVAEALIGRPAAGGSGTTVSRLIDGSAAAPARAPAHHPRSPVTTHDGVTPPTATTPGPTATTSPATTAPAATGSATPAPTATASATPGGSGTPGAPAAPGTSPAGPSPAGPSPDEPSATDPAPTEPPAAEPPSPSPGDG